MRMEGRLCHCRPARHRAVACRPKPVEAFVEKPLVRYCVPERYWITSSAVANSVSGMVSPSALAVLRLITSSNLVGCMIGRSAGFSPLYGALEVKHYISQHSPLPSYQFLCST